jgi:hypothetical protein
MMILGSSSFEGDIPQKTGRRSHTARGRLSESSARTGCEGLEAGPKPSRPRSSLSVRRVCLPGFAKEAG